MTPTSECLPQRFSSVEELEMFQSRPSAELVAELSGVDGDILILGVGGKMGPTLARLARNAGGRRRVIGVARFSTAGLQQSLEAHGVETIAVDLLDHAALQRLPPARNVIFMAGRKFGASSNQPLTWAMNAYLPGLVAEAFRQSRIIAFSTGNVYPLVEVASQGATESTPLGPPGEYANSCVGRERVFEYFSRELGTPGRLFRLNYAIDLRYGVLTDLALKVRDGKPVDVTMGHVNVIWQGDANERALRCLAHCTVPTSPINVSGSEIISIRWLAHEFAARLGREAYIVGTEASDAWLTNTSAAAELFGPPSVPMTKMIDWTADWITRDLPLLNKPTHFEVRDGAY
ncbi:MAG: epimerase [Proteobacteria bacterium]|nr:MAG: epimerase [Pseudomonadota bacterium]